MVKVKVLADSISEEKVRLVTIEAEYPRIIHSELLTHRMFSRNSASSRAIPFNKMCEQLTGMPSKFGSNKSGMQDGGNHTSKVQIIELAHNGRATISHLSPELAWGKALESSAYYAKAFSDAGYHKQVFNRLTEPFQMIKTVISSTEWSNFLWLRDDDAADPTIRELAVKIKEALDKSIPTVLSSAQWHLPYVYTEGGKYFLTAGGTELTLDDAKMVSAARCAAVSYRNTDYTLEKCRSVWSNLIGSDKKHASALEHQAKPMINSQSNLHGDVNFYFYPETWENGISSVDKECGLWSGNFRGWVQLRKTIEGESM